MVKEGSKMTGEGVTTARDEISMHGHFRLSFVRPDQFSKLKKEGPKGIEKELVRDWEDNLIVYTGKHWACDRLFNHDAAAYTAGGENGYPSAMGLGTGLATNTGVPGPDTAVCPTGGDWQGASLADWRLSGEIYGNGGCRATLQGQERTGATMYCFGLFTNAQFDYSGGVCNIREVGVFLSATEATANPDDISAQKPYSMMSRHCFYRSEGGFYEDWPIAKQNDGMAIMVEYELTIN